MFETLSAVLGVIKYGIIAVILWEVASQVGQGIARFASAKKADSLDTFGYGLLLGWPVLGIVYLGLSLTGVLYPSLIVISGLVLAFFKPETLRPRLLIVDAARAFGPGTKPGLILFAACLMPFVFHIIVPELDVDCYIYHLGVPWQFLQSHRVLIDFIPRQFHLPLPIEMTYVLPMALGEAHLAKWVNLSFFLAVSAIFAARHIRLGDRTTALLGPMLVLPLFQLCWLLPLSKNDVASGALVVAGVLAHGKKQWILSALLFGCGVAAKLVAGPFVLAWWLLNPPPLRRLPALIACLVLPILPWFGKSFIATANPIYPLASSLIPSFGWTESNATVWFKCARPIMALDTFDLKEIPFAWWRYATNSHVLVGILLPGLALLGRQRRAIWACIIGGAVILAFGHIPRYMISTLWLPCLIAAEEIAHLGPRLRRWVRQILFGAVILQLAFHPRLNPIPWRSSFQTQEETLRHGLTTYQEAIAATRARPGERFLNVCTPRIFPLSGRIIYGGLHGETPLVWKIVKESRTVQDIAKGFRQLGTRFILYNFVQIEWVALRYEAFAWSDRMISLYRDFLKRHLTVASTPEQVDIYHNGGFYLFEITKVPLRPPQKSVFYAPGTEVLYANAMSLRKAGRFREAIVAGGQVMRILPDVDHTWNELGLSHGYLGDWPMAYRYLSPAVKRGMIADSNIITLASAALALSKYDEADRLFARALVIAPKSRDMIQIHRGVLRYHQAYGLMKKKPVATGKLLTEGLSFLISVSPTWSDSLMSKRRQCMSLTYGLLADIAIQRGDNTTAAQFYRQALETAPENKYAAAWRKRVQQLSGGRKLF